MREPERITSAQNPRVKQAARLRDRRGRRRQQRILIDGARETARALEGGVEILDVFVCDDPQPLTELSPLLQQLTARGSRVAVVDRSVFAKLAYGQRDDGMVAVAAWPTRRLSEFCLPANALVAVLEGLEKPGNVGAIIRSADAAGVDAVLIADAGTDLYNPNAIRASIGTIFTQAVFSVTTAEAIAWLHRERFRVLVARVDGAIWYDQADYQSRAAIVLGSEAWGVSSAWKDPAFPAIQLPMHGTVDSLNVSVTAAVLFYEASRQRRLIDPAKE